MALPPVLQSILGFLRAGYPEGVPEHDYLPLFALLRRRLSEDEVAEVANELVANSPDEQTTHAIHLAIVKLINSEPSEADIDHVRAQLEAAGWEPPTHLHI